MPGISFRCAGFVIFFWLILGNSTGAFADYPFKITRVKVGFPPGPFSNRLDENGQVEYLFKAGTWAPLFVEIEGVDPSLQARNIEIIVEAPDGNDVIARQSKVVFYTPEVKKSSYHPFELPCVKLGGINSEVTVRLREPNTTTELAAAYRAGTRGLTAGKYLVLGIGAGFKGLRLPKVEGSASDASSESVEPLRNGWVELAALPMIGSDAENSLHFPRAEGLDGVDVLVMSSDQPAGHGEHILRDYPQSLYQWVKRGGHLILSVGKNADKFSASASKRSNLADLLPIKIVDRTEVSSLPMLLPNHPRIVLPALAGTKIPVARIEPKAGSWHTVRLSADDAVNPLPLVVQGSYGFGRVTVVLFDLELPPMPDWRYREVFWEWLLNVGGPQLPSGKDKVADIQLADKEDQYLELLHTNLDTFENVPVISFGWIALAILGYLILIGPVERYILRRFFRRFEWTWLTAPIIVVGLSLLVVWNANDTKGSEVKVNKIDLIDFDLQLPAVHGQSWFSIYSPKIDHYDITVEPVGFHADAYQPLHSWFGQARGTRQSIFRQHYEIKNDVVEERTGIIEPGSLAGVPIQTWSTKEFTADWLDNPVTYQVRPDRPFTSTLHIAEGDPNQIVGSITSNLPIPIITDAQLIYREKITPVPPLMPGVPRFIATTAQASSATTWLLNASDFKDPAGSKIGKARSTETDLYATFRLWPILQHELTLAQFAGLQNASFRDLDQSWRVNEKNPYQAILLARIGTTEDRAEAMNNNPASPTRIKLNGSTSFAGTIRQETYIRVLIPVK
jgi:hypothetical protein